MCDSVESKRPRTFRGVMLAGTFCKGILFAAMVTLLVSLVPVEAVGSPHGPVGLEFTEPVGLEPLWVENQFVPETLREAMWSVISLRESGPIRFQNPYVGGQAAMGNGPYDVPSPSVQVVHPVKIGQ